MRTSAWIAVTAVSLSAISVSYAKGVVPEAVNGLEPLAPVSSSEPSQTSEPAPSTSADAPSTSPDPSSSSVPSTSQGSGGGTKPTPKPTKSSDSGSTSTTAPKPSTPPPPPEPVVKTINSDMMSYKYGQLQIAVTFKGSTITDITMLYGENNNGRGEAYPVLIKAAIAAQGTKFGNYTGATYTTNVFKDALANAIAKL